MDQLTNNFSNININDDIINNYEISLNINNYNINQIIIGYTDNINYMKIITDNNKFEYLLTNKLIFDCKMLLMYGTNHLILYVDDGKLYYDLKIASNKVEGNINVNELIHHKFINPKISKHGSISVVTLSYEEKGYIINNIIRMISVY
jgi:hypothetical protein